MYHQKINVSRNQFSYVLFYVVFFKSLVNFISCFTMRDVDGVENGLESSFSVSDDRVSCCIRRCAAYRSRDRSTWSQYVAACCRLLLTIFNMAMLVCSFFQYLFFRTHDDVEISWIFSGGLYVYIFNIQ
jgi:hypothetical protein